MYLSTYAGLGSIAVQQSDPTLLGDEIDATFPVAGSVERIWLLRALEEIVSRVPWVAEHLGVENLALVIATFRHQAVASLHPGLREIAPKPMGGSYGLADAVIGTGRVGQPAGISTFRGLLWIAIWWCRERGNLYESRAQQIASTLRSVAFRPGDKASRVLDSHLRLLGETHDLQAAIAVLDGLTAQEHKSLYEAWNAWLKPTLLAASAELKSRPKKTPASPERSEKRGESADSIEYFPLRSRRVPPDQPWFEPPEEFGADVNLVLVPGYGTGALSRSQADYRARQAVWGRNYLLLTSHAEALFPDVFGAVVRALVEYLEATDTLDPLACIGCLLKAMTARVTKAFATLRIAPAPSSKADEASWYLDLDAGLLSFPPYWKQPFPRLVPNGAASEVAEPGPSFFEPTVAQKPFVCPVDDFVTIPIPAPIRRVLSKHRALLGEINTIPSSKLDRRMGAVVTEIAGKVGVPLSVARLRASLGPLVMEASGDLAMAQIICGDSFGRPSAQQHYYAPRRKDVAAAYVSAMEVCFGGSGSARIGRESVRVGSNLLVDAATAKHLAQASFNWHHDATDPAVGPNHALCAHRRILDHLVRMMLATTGHRWASSLFHLRLTDIDLDTGAVLFADKVHDVAHDPRLAVMPKVLGSQFRAYIRHVACLIATYPDLRGDLSRVLRGEAPLLFDLQEVDGRCAICVPTLREIAERGPPEWNVLPGNWGRTYVRTRAIEMGAPAFLVACQLGHYDAVGYPYSNQSPTEPIEVLQKFQPWLDRVAATQSWAIIEPEAPSHADEIPRLESAWPYRSIRNWRDELQDADERASKAHRKWQASLYRNARKAREQATAAVLKHPAVVASGIAAVYQTEKCPTQAPQLAELDLYSVRAELLMGCGDDDAMALGRLRALRHVLGVVAKRLNQPTPSVSIPIAVRRPLDNAFFRGACLGLSQLRLLRANVRDRAQERRPRRDWITQAARTAESLLLFGGIDDVDTLISLLAARGSARPSARLPDLALVPLAGGRVVALRGLAALALQNLAKQFPDHAMPSIAEIETAMSALLPPWAVAGLTSNLLQRLCSTVSVANRFEYSPAARFALDPVHGSASASIDEQLAFIDGDATGPTRVVEDESTTPPPPKRMSSGGPASGRALTQYRKLVAAIPTVGKAYESPFTRRQVLASSVRSETTRAAIVADLDAWLIDSDEGRGEILWPIVRMLGEWTKAELTRLKDDGKPLQFRSVLTYLTRIGRALTQELGELDAARWTEWVVEDAYSFALEASSEAKFKVAASLLSFHRSAEAHFDMPEVDLSGVYAALAAGERRVDAALILPVERKAAFASIAKHAWEEGAGDPHEVMIARQADAVTALLGYAGARLSEPLGMQVRDVGVRPDGMPFVRVRSNRLRSLKTAAATRVLLFGPALDTDHLRRVFEWTDAVRKSAGANRPDGVYLISAADNRNDLSDQGAVGALIRAELARATGRQSERLHRLRHLVATERMVALTCSANDASRLGLQEDPVRERVLQPRDFHGISVSMGHALWATTLEWYLHIAWILKSHANARQRDAYLDRRTVASVLGLTPSAVDSLSRHNQTDHVAVWFDSVRSPRVVPAAPPSTVSDGGESPPSSTWVWTAKAVAHLVEEAWRAHDLMAPVMRQGIPLGECERIEVSAARWEQKLGLRVIPQSVGNKERQCPARAIRRLESDCEFEPIFALMDRMEGGQHCNIRRVVGDFFTYLTPRSGDCMTLPATTAHMLHTMLVEIGIPSNEILMGGLAGDLTKLSLTAHSAQGRALRGRGRGLKRVLTIVGLTIALQSLPSRFSGN